METAEPKRPPANDNVARFSAVRSYTEKLCEPLQTEDYVPQPIVDVSPAKWNIAHTTWFFEEMILKEFVRGYQPFHPQFNFLFNSYYNSVGDRTKRDARGALSRPLVSEVFEYRKYIDEKMVEFLAGDPPEKAVELLTLGINHEQQHQELLLSDLKYMFGQNPLLPAYREGFFPEETAETPITGGFEIAAGNYEIGFEGGGFCFDNELGRHTVHVGDFAIRQNLVRNSEYMLFIADGGYNDHRLWLSEAWDWIAANHVEAPLYWYKNEGEWWTFTLGGPRRVVPEAPVCHISYYEAAAYAEWKSRRLPTEFEWEIAAEHLGRGLRWEWTNSAYLPYPGFSKRPGAVGEYNGKFMINQMVLRGASIATPPGHSRITYRNFFQPHLRWQFTGIRLAK